MRRIAIFYLFPAIFLIAAGFWSYQIISERFMEPTPRADRLFKPHGPEAYAIARDIERGQTIDVAAIETLENGVNARYGEDITLLFHALASRNTSAIDTLLANGADPYMFDRPSQGSKNDFTHYLTLPGHPADPSTGFPFINELIRIYLKNGGNPNHRSQAPERVPLVADVALIDNYEGVNILLKAGADPWAASGRNDNAMTRLAGDNLSHDEINLLIDQGYFDQVAIEKLREFMSWLSLYTPRDDDITKANREIALRVLKRNPEYSQDASTERLFQGPISAQAIEAAR